jgi:hypothetical protein
MEGRVAGRPRDDRAPQSTSLERPFRAIQNETSSLTSSALAHHEVAEPLSALPICIVQRTGLPLTPAAEYFCTLVRRLSA